MQYVFLDESYPRALRRDQKTTIIAASGVEQDRFRRRISGKFDPYNQPVLQRIKSMFDSLDALGVLGTADQDTSLFRSGEIDRIDDIPAMARPDNIWSQCAIFVVSTLILELLHSGRETGPSVYILIPTVSGPNTQRRWLKTCSHRGRRRTRTCLCQCRR